MHPGEEVAYILAGTVEMEIHGQPTLTLQAGDPFLMPPRARDNGCSSVNGRVDGGDPRAV
jgi:uncharacterized cupin superfamily protein